MSNEISNHSRPLISLESVRSEGQAQARSRDQTASPALTKNADQVSLTGETQLLRAIEQSLKTEPVVNQQKVDRVKAAIKSGEFEVNPEKIASKLFDLESHLAHGTK